MILKEDGGYKLYVIDSYGVRSVDIAAEDVARVEVLEEDGGADSRKVLAALWCEWMRQVMSRSKATARDVSPLRPYPHQSQAVYGSMLPQPLLRFLLADEPGTGKTIMGGLWLRESQRRGFVKRALVVAPAHLVSKWQEDISRFLNGDLRRITMSTIQEGALAGPHDWWIVSLDLAAVNPAVYEAIHPERAGWDAVVFDEAHRLTPSAEQYYRVGRMLSKSTSRTLLMTATPHRGNEALFRSLMHLVDPQVFPEPVNLNPKPSQHLKPGPLHFLRRMKEELYDYDGETRLFKAREARNVNVPLNVNERGFYNEALDLVDEYFPPDAVVLAKMVYGKRAASSLYALQRTLERRRDGMGRENPADAAISVDPHGQDDSERDEARVVNEVSKASREEKQAIDEILERLTEVVEDAELPVSKWPQMVDKCLAPHQIVPDSDRQAVVFTEFADTANWLVDRFESHGYTARRYSGADSYRERDEIRARFAAGEFQVIVSTDAGNEGIDLQTAQVLVNWDMPWSLVRLEQRMGRIHRIGQTDKVWLYNLVATDTREGDAYFKLLENLMAAANELDGKMFDSLSMVGEAALEKEAGDKSLEKYLRKMYKPNTPPPPPITAEQFQSIHQEQREGDSQLASQLDIEESLRQLYAEQLARINPHIVERFLHRAAGAGLFIIDLSAIADRGFWYLSPGELNFPKGLSVETETGKALVSTSGQVKQEAVDSGVSRASEAVTLGPGEPVFQDLVSTAGDHLRPFLYQGALLTDPTTVTDYEIHLFEAEVSEGGGRRKEVWSYLVRVDETGARLSAWETLSNLEPVDSATDKPHPALITKAEQVAQGVLWEQRDNHRLAMEKWVADARKNLRRLPNELTDDIVDRERRLSERSRIEQAIDSRIEELDKAVQIEVRKPLSRIGWARVKGAGSVDIEEKNSEQIAMRLVVDLLEAKGWKVADVHTEGLGYDLHARQGHRQQCVEVKGIWDKASSRGVTLTGNEMVRAGLLGEDYWLYIVDRCSEGGTLYFAYSDPAALFAELTRDITSLHIKGSDLEIAKAGQ